MLLFFRVSKHTLCLLTLHVFSDKLSNCVLCKFTFSFERKQNNKKLRVIFSCSPGKDSLKSSEEKIRGNPLTPTNHYLQADSLISELARSPNWPSSTRQWRRCPGRKEPQFSLLLQYLKLSGPSLHPRTDTYHDKQSCWRNTPKIAKSK